MDINRGNQFNLEGALPLFPIHTIKIHWGKSLGPSAIWTHCASTDISSLSGHGIARASATETLLQVGFKCLFAACLTMMLTLDDAQSCQQ